jgi:hypothetical protein
MSKEMREQIDKVKNWKQFLNENNVENLTQLIIKVREEFVDTNNCSIEQINQGLCVDFLDEIEDRFNGRFDTLTTSQFVISDDRIEKELKSDEVLKYGDIGWYKYMLDEYGYPDVELMDTEPPKHIWIYYNGKHYDAEEPNGVDNPWDLPIFEEYNWF